VKVYTRPVSETTRSRTWVPVRTDNSYAWRTLHLATLFSAHLMELQAQWMKCGVTGSEFGGGRTDLLHDASLAFRESDVSTRFILNEFDVNLPPLATGLVIVVVVVVGSSTDARTLDTSSLSAIAIAGRVIKAGGGLVVGISDVGHVWQSALLIRSEDDPNMV